MELSKRIRYLIDIYTNELFIVKKNLDQGYELSDVDYLLVQEQENLIDKFIKDLKGVLDES